jgi:hypothetical protein
MILANIYKLVIYVLYQHSTLLVNIFIHNAMLIFTNFLSTFVKSK